MISFLPITCHPNPQKVLFLVCKILKYRELIFLKVLIVGGGDGGVARELVKHPLG